MLVYQHDNYNVCACAPSALILLPVENLSLELNSVTSIPIRHTNFSTPTLLFAYFRDFSLRICSFDLITASGLIFDVIFEFFALLFL